MKEKSPVLPEEMKSRLTGLLPADMLMEKAKALDFVKRKPRAITPEGFVHAACSVVLTACVSLELLAFAIGARRGRHVSKQAVGRRLGTTEAVAFMYGVVSHVLSSSLGLDECAKNGVFAHFGRVLVQDSTCVSLRDSLADAFPGSRNQRGSSAQAKIQTVYDLRTEQFVQFGIDPFRRNDQAASSDILALLRENDLVIRDLGYHVLETFAAIGTRKAFFLSRLRHDIASFGKDSDARIDLLATLRRHGSFDAVVRLGAEEKLEVRLAAVPVPAAVAAARRRDLRTNRDRRCQPSREHMDLCDWELFVTNVPADVWPPETIGRIYNLRWRIETVFKAWKSHFHMRKIDCTSPAFVKVAICARLICIMAFQTFYTVVCACTPSGTRTTSLLKCARLFMLCITTTLAACIAMDEEKLAALVGRHARHDKRRRRSYAEKRDALLHQKHRAHRRLKP
jgi:hypothetical protein